MKTTTLFAFLAASLTPATCLAFVAQAAPVTFDWATVGNAGNRNDPETGFGGVSYAYRISKHEVTNAQYTAFLNAVASSDTNQLYDTEMGSVALGGIVRTGSSGSYTYSVKADALGQGPDGSDYTYGDIPVTIVSFFNAMRFVNWLENGQPTGTQDSSTTEDGVYSISNGISEVRAASATYFLPNEDEWYKAAYHKNDGVTGNYWDYPTSTDMAPNNNLPSVDTGNSANFFDDGFTTGGTGGNLDLPMTNVGAYLLSSSPYGTFDQGGNVSEWNEATAGSDFRGERGGDWLNTSSLLLASSNRFSNVRSEFGNKGIRVASIIPEPSTQLLSALTSVGLLMRRRRRTS